MASINMCFGDDDDVGPARTKTAPWVQLRGKSWLSIYAVAGSLPSMEKPHDFSALKCESLVLVTPSGRPGG